MNEIFCTDRNGNENQFQYSIERKIDSYGKNVIIFRVTSVNKTAIDHFEFKVAQINNNTAKVTGMSHNNEPEYIGKGIPEKMIEEANKILELIIISSSNRVAHKYLETEWRTKEATKVWDRLVSQGKAIYNAETDIYTFKNLEKT